MVKERDNNVVEYVRVDKTTPKSKDDVLIIVSTPFNPVDVDKIEEYIDKGQISELKKDVKNVPIVLVPGETILETALWKAVDLMKSSGDAATAESFETLLGQGQYQVRVNNTPVNLKGEVDYYVGERGKRYFIANIVKAEAGGDNR